MPSQLTIRTPCATEVAAHVLDIAIKVFPEFIIWVDDDNICIGPPGDDGAAPVPAVVPDPPPTLPGKFEIKTPELPDGQFPPFTRPYIGCGSIKPAKEYPGLLYNGPDNPEAVMAYHDRQLAAAGV